MTLSFGLGRVGGYLGTVFIGDGRPLPVEAKAKIGIEPMLLINSHVVGSKKTCGLKGFWPFGGRDQVSPFFRQMHHGSLSPSVKWQRDSTVDGLIDSHIGLTAV